MNMNVNETNTRADRDLAVLADVPPPRRTDDAFARSVQDGVRARRSRGWFALPALAATAAAFVFVVMRPGPTDERVVAIAPIAVPAAVANAPMDLYEDDEDALFALPMLDGSSDEELAQLDQVLDRKLSAQRGER